MLRLGEGLNWDLELAWLPTEFSYPHHRLALTCTPQEGAETMLCPLTFGMERLNKRPNATHPAAPLVRPGLGKGSPVLPSPFKASVTTGEGAYRDTVSSYPGTPWILGILLMPGTESPIPDAKRNLVGWVA